MYNLTILWKNGETSIGPLLLIAADDPVSHAIYAKKNNLINLPGWKRLKGLANRQGQLFRLINQAKLHNFENKPLFKYGYEIPKNYKHAIEIDRQSRNTLWQDATKLEFDFMTAYEVFKDLGYKAAPPPKYKTIQVHLIYDFKHNGRHMTRLVVSEHLTDVPGNSVYSSVSLFEVYACYSSLLN